MKLTLTRYRRLRNWLKYTPLRTQVSYALFFAMLSWKLLRGKITIMDTELMNSNAGYKYKAYIISKIPVSDKHTYEDL